MVKPVPLLPLLVVSETGDTTRIKTNLDRIATASLFSRQLPSEEHQASRPGRIGVLVGHHRVRRVGDEET